MQELRTIARPYALAAFEHAREAGEIASWSTALGNLAALTANPDMQVVIGHPGVSAEQMLDLVIEVLGPGLNTGQRNFIETLIEAERLRVATEIAELYEQHKTLAEGIVHVAVTSAYALKPDEEAIISSAVRARIGKDCEVTCEVDPELIGGAVIRIGDAVIDLSIRGRLKALEQELN